MRACSLWKAPIAASVPMPLASGASLVTISPLTNPASVVETGTSQGRSITTLLRDCRTSPPADGGVYPAIVPRKTRVNKSIPRTGASARGQRLFQLQWRVPSTFSDTRDLPVCPYEEPDRSLCHVLKEPPKLVRHRYQRNSPSIPWRNSCIYAYAKVP
jgi:hypothetical protein